MNLPIISIIVPVYNAEKYLTDCINSLLTQSYGNLEIILVNDGSKDSSGEICDSYARSRKNIKVLHLENGGPSRARNHGLSIAIGEYIGFVDSDDYVDKEMYQSLYSAALGNNADLVMCGVNTIIDNVIEPLSMNYESIYKSNNSIKNDLVTRFYVSDHNGLLSVWNKLFKREIIDKYKLIFDESIDRGEDAWFIFEYLKKSSTVCFIKDRLYYYRQIENSLMHRIKPEDYQRYKRYRIKLENKLKEIGISFDYNDLYYSFLINSITYCKQMAYKKEKNLVMNVLEDSYFKNACRYSNRLPVHFKIICSMETKGLYTLLKLVLKFWCLLK